jgi:hypothetical protein
VPDHLTVIAAPEAQVMWLVSQIERTVNETAVLLVALAVVCEEHPKLVALAQRLMSEAGVIDQPLPVRQHQARPMQRRPMGRRR